jgi:HrpA-like RNA helicase
MYIAKQSENILPEFEPVRNLLDQESPDSLPFLGYDLTKTARDQLPIYSHQKEILFLAKKSDVTIIVGEPGAGKTSQLPQILFNARYATGKMSICVVLPSRVSVVASANRVAGEMRTEVGLGVGYSYLYSSKFSKYTKVKFITYQCLLKEIQRDPSLSCYSVVILDDIHVRTLEQDMALYLMRRITRYRKSKNSTLKLFLMSATIDIESMLNYFESKETSTDELLSVDPIQINGVKHPVATSYLKEPAEDIMIAALQLTVDLHLHKPLDQDILVFLPSIQDVDRFASLLKEEMESHKCRNFSIVQLHSRLLIVEQMRLFETGSEKSNIRKIIAATSVAQTGITIESVSIVVDTLLERIRQYDYETNSYRHLTCFVSKFTAKQRAGRAGRTRPGECYRLATKADFQKLLPQFPVPQIAYANLDYLYMYFRSVRVRDFYSLSLPTSFDRNNLLKSLETLYSLKIIDLNGELTTGLGDTAAKLPLEPTLAVMLLNSYKPEFGCSEEILTLVSMLSAGNVFAFRKDSGSILKFKKTFGAKEGDLLTLVNLFTLYYSQSNRDRKQFCNERPINEYVLVQAAEIKQSLESAFEKLGRKKHSSADDVECLQRCICSALFANVAQINPDGSYRLLMAEKTTVHLHPTSIANTNYPRWVVYHSLEESTEDNSKMWIKDVSQIEVSWLTELVPDYFEDTKQADVEKKRQSELKTLDGFDNKRVKQGTEHQDHPNFSKRLTQGTAPKKKNIISVLQSDEEI